MCFFIIRIIITIFLISFYYYCHHHHNHHHRHLGKTFYLSKSQGFLSTLELSEMNSEYDTVTMFLSVSVINNISNQNLQKSLSLISIPNFEKCDSSLLLVFSITLQAEYRFYAVANLTTYRPTTVSREDAYFRRVIIIYNFRTGDTRIAPPPPPPPPQHTPHPPQ